MIEFTVIEYLLLSIPVALLVLILVIALAVLAIRRPIQVDPAEQERQERLHKRLRLLEADHVADMAQISGLREEVFYLGRLISMMADRIQEAGLLLPDDVVDYLRRRHNNSPIVADPELVVLVQHALDRFFDQGELRQLAFEMGVDFDNLPGVTKEDKARELVLFVDRRGQLEMLVQHIVMMRPNVPLPWLGGRGPP